MTAETPSSQEVDERRNNGDFDLLMNNWNDLQNTPWTYFDYVFRQPVRDVQSVANFGRYVDEGAWTLIEQLSRTASDSPEYAQIMGQLQEILLTDMPMIPIWYNGLWSQ